MRELVFPVLRRSSSSWSSLGQLYGFKNMSGKYGSNLKEKAIDMKPTEQLGKNKPDVLDLNDIIVEAIIKKPGLMVGASEKKTVTLVRLVLEKIASKLDKIEEGKVKIPSLGNFRVQRLEREQDGKIVTVRRVIFNTLSKKKEV